jgi:hypothetical protein
MLCLQATNRPRQRVFCTHYTSHFDAQAGWEGSTNTGQTVDGELLAGNLPTPLVRFYIRKFTMTASIELSEIVQHLTEGPVDELGQDLEECLDYYYYVLSDLSDEMQDVFFDSFAYQAVVTLMQGLTQEFELFRRTGENKPQKAPETGFHIVMSDAEPIQLPAYEQVDTDRVGDNSIMEGIRERARQRRAKEAALANEDGTQDAITEETGQIFPPGSVAVGTGIFRTCTFCDKPYSAPDMSRRYRYCSRDCRDADSFHHSRMEIFSRDEHTCIYCGASPLKNDDVVLHVDHVDPISKGGIGIAINLVTSCDKCNLSKSDNELRDEVRQKVLAVICERNTEAGIPQDKTFPMLDASRQYGPI